MSGGAAPGGGPARTRFAPSPTGRLHVGNVRVALVNWLWARKTGGDFLLRLDDTDAERSRADHAAAIERDLSWLGLAWDRFARQSDRLDRYRAAAERLKEAGRLYPCYETAEELELARHRWRLSLEIVERVLRRRVASETGGSQRRDDEDAERDCHHRHEQPRAQAARGLGHDAGGSKR